MTRPSCSVWRKMPSGPCEVIRTLIGRRNEKDFFPFLRFSVCYCSPAFDRADVPPAPTKRHCLSINYLVTGLEDAPELTDEQNEAGGVGRWLDWIGGLTQPTATKSVYVLNAELWLRTPGRVSARLELESEHVPLTRSSQADIRTVLRSVGPEGSLLLVDIILHPGGRVVCPLLPNSLTLSYVFGGSVQFGEENSYFGKGSFLQMQGESLAATAPASGGRFLLLCAAVKAT